MAKIKTLLKKDPHLTRLFLIFILVFVIMSVLRPDTFLTVENFRSMAVQFPELGFLSIAAALALISGGIDLSVMGTASLSAIVAAYIMHGAMEGGNDSIWVIILAVIAALLVGAACGILNALLISKVGISSLLATLGTYNLYTGFGVVLTKGSSISNFPAGFQWIGNGSIIGVPVPLILFLIGIFILSYFLNRTKLGYKLYVFGTNPQVSFYSAIDNQKVIFRTYFLSGVVSSIAGIIMLSRINTAKADFGSSYGLQALLVAVLGGVSPSGGSGKAAGIFLAIVTLQCISSGFNLLHVSAFLKNFTWGALLVLVMLLNTVHRREKKKEKTEEKAAA